MKKIEVEITGTSALLMNSPNAMLDPKPVTKSKLKEYIPEVEAEKCAYRTSKGKLYVPTTALKGTLMNGAAWKKSGKFALKPLIAGSTRIYSKTGNGEVILSNQKYTIDIRTVVIQRARVAKARPKIEDWKLDFMIEYNELQILSDEIIKDSLADAGQRVGLLDFRPQKGGEFGTFKITKWKLVK